jgi:hypothetical protein
LTPPSRPRTTEISAIAGDADDQDDLHGEVVRNTEHVLETRIGLLRADAERGGQAEQRREDREDIDDMARPAPDAFAEDRVEGRAYGERQALVVAEQRERQRQHRIDRPGVQAPVIDRSRKAHLPGCFDIFRDEHAVRVKR